MAVIETRARMGWWAPRCLAHGNVWKSSLLETGYYRRQYIHSHSDMAICIHDTIFYWLPSRYLLSSTDVQHFHAYSARLPPNAVEEMGKNSAMNGKKFLRYGKISILERKRRKRNSLHGAEHIRHLANRMFACITLTHTHKRSRAVFARQMFAFFTMWQNNQIRSENVKWKMPPAPSAIWAGAWRWRRSEGARHG